MAGSKADPEYVRMERDRGFASRHGTERGDDPVFDELYDYAADLRKCIREISICDACNSNRLACNPRAYEANIERYNAALKAGRRLIKGTQGDAARKLKTRKAEPRRPGRDVASYGDLAEIWGVD